MGRVMAATHALRRAPASRSIRPTARGDWTPGALSTMDPAGHDGWSDRTVASKRVPRGSGRTAAILPRRNATSARSDAIRASRPSGSAARPSPDAAQGLAGS